MPLPVIEAGIPEELKKSGARWCVWKLEQRDGKDTKVPYQSETRKGQSNNPKSWLTYEQAINQYRGGSFAGIGLYMGGNLKDGFDELTGLDWDHLKEAGISTDEIIGIQSYAETSPSGTGARCFCLLDKIPGEKKKKNDREIYKSGRFLTVTGHHIEGSPSSIKPADPEGLKVFYTRLCGEEQADLPTQKEEVIPDRAEDEIIRIAGKNKKFHPLWKGQVSDDHSADDMALCNILAWASGRDPVMMDRVFRRSGLYRDKWDENRGTLTYGQITIQKAISDCKEVWEDKPKQQQKEPEPVTLKEHDDTPLTISKLNLTDIGNGLRFKDNYGEKFRFDHTGNIWYMWNGQIWQDDKGGCVKKAAQYTIAKMAEEIEVFYKSGDEKAGDAVYKHMKKSASERARNDMLRSASPHMAVEPGIWNSKHNLMNLQNGTLELDTLQFRGFRQEDYLTFKAGVKYDPAAPCSEWLDHLNLVFGGDTELISAFQLMAGYSLLSGNPAQVFFILYGAGKNGKSVTVNTLRMIMGDYGIHVAPQTLMQQKNPDKIRSDLVRLQYKRLVTSTEGERGAKLDIGWIKQMTGGEPIVARPLYKAEIEFIPEFALWFATNHLPEIKEVNEAIWRRLWPIPFNQVIPEDKRITDYEKKLLESEGSGIFNWMIEGLKRYYEAGHLIKPQAVIDLMEEYKEDEDPIHDYLTSQCTDDEKAVISSSDLYQDYQKWCEFNGVKYPISQTRFSTCLIDHGYERKKTKSIRVFTGLRFKTQAEIAAYVTEQCRETNTIKTGLNPSDDRK